MTVFNMYYIMKIFLQPAKKYYMLSFFFYHFTNFLNWIPAIKMLCCYFFLAYMQVMLLKAANRSNYDLRCMKWYEVLGQPSNKPEKEYSIALKCQYYCDLYYRPFVDLVRVLNAMLIVDLLCRNLFHLYTFIISLFGLAHIPVSSFLVKHFMICIIWAHSPSLIRQKIFWIQNGAEIHLKWLSFSLYIRFL